MARRRRRPRSEVDRQPASSSSSAAAAAAHGHQEASSGGGDDGAAPWAEDKRRSTVPPEGRPRHDGRSSGSGSGSGRGSGSRDRRGGGGAGNAGDRGRRRGGGGGGGGNGDGGGRQTEEYEVVDARRGGAAGRGGRGRGRGRGNGRASGDRQGDGRGSGRDADGNDANEPSPAQRLFLDEETLSYFAEVESMLDEARFTDDEDRGIFVQNVYKEIEGKLLSLMAHHDCSRVLEKLVRVSTAYQLRTLLTQLGGKALKAVTTRHSSHVLQAMLACAARQLDRGDADVSGPLPKAATTDVSPPQPLAELIASFADELAPTLRDLAADAYASHVLQTLLAVLAGEPETDGLRSKRSRDYRAKAAVAETAGKRSTATLAPLKIPDQFPAKLMELVDALIPGVTTGLVDADAIRDGQRAARALAMDPQGSPLLQSLISILARRDPSSLARLLARLLAEDDGEAVDSEAEADDDDATTNQRGPASFVGSLLLHAIGSHVLEAILDVCDGAAYMRLYTTCFRGRMKSLSTDPIGGFVVAKLVATVHTATQLDMLSDELYPELATMLADPRQARLLTALATAIGRIGGPSRRRLITELLRAANCQAPSLRRHFLSSILAMRPYTAASKLSGSETPQAAVVADGDGAAPDAAAGDGVAARATVPGSLIVQVLWGFDADDLAPLVESLIALPVDDYVALSKTFPGSRALEGFFTSKAAIPIKQRVLRRLNGHYAELAVDKYGSHIVDAAWRASDLNQKTAIAGELANRDAWVATSFYGQMALRNCNIDKFKRRRDDWAEAALAQQRKTEMFAELIDAPIPEDAPPQKKKKIEQASTDEIEQLFSAAIPDKSTYKKHKISSSNTTVSAQKSTTAPVQTEIPDDVKQVWDAIAATKKSDGVNKRKK